MRNCGSVKNSVIYCMLFFTQYNLTPKNYSENLMLSLDMLYKEVSDGQLGNGDLLSVKACTYSTKIICRI